MPNANSTPNTFDELLESAPLQLAKIAHHLRSVIIAIHPETIEVIYLGYSSASYGLGPKKNSEAYCYIMPQKDRINLGFYYGAMLDDPAKRLEGTGKKLRHAKIYSIDDADSPAIHQLIQTALLERQAFFNK